MTNRDTDIVSTFRKVMVDKVGADRFSLWFDQPECLSLEDGTLNVQAADQFSLDRLRVSFRDDLQAACRAVFGQELEINFHLASTSNGPSAEGAECRCLGPAAAEPVDADDPSIDPPDDDRAPRKRFASLRSFVVGDTNRMAQMAATNVTRRLGAVSPMFLYGPPGCGKTHLLQGIWTEMRRTGQRGRFLMLSAEQFTSYFLEALHGGGLPSFRRRYRQVDLLLLDDIQFFVGKRATLVELQHTLDTLLREGHQVILAADRPPVEINGIGQELITRMCSGLVCGIEAADRDLRLRIAKQLSAERSFKIPAKVLELVAAEIPGDARQISGALNRLHATSQALEQPITIELAEAALADIIRSTHAPVRMEDIDRAVCDVFGLDAKVLQSSRRSKGISQPRMLAMWLARKYTRAAYSEIGEYFGHRSHSTVISAQKKVTGWVSSGTPIHLAHSDCKVDDAIRRVELRLRTG